VPGRFVLAYGNIQAGPWEWVPSSEVRAFFERRRTGSDDMLGFQLAFDAFAKDCTTRPGCPLGQDPARTTAATPA